MNKKYIITLCILCLLSIGCKELTFSESIEINAPVSTVFSVITDYESYNLINPELHEKMRIVSDKKEGEGVIWESTGKFKIFKIKTAWEVTQFEQNKFITMEDTKGQLGYTTLKVRQIDTDKTEFTTTTVSTMFIPLRNTMFGMYREEMMAFKNVSEDKFKN